MANKIENPSVQEMKDFVPLKAVNAKTEFVETGNHFNLNRVLLLTLTNLLFLE